MQLRTQQYLLDVAGSCREIIEFTKDDPDVILSDRLTALAVERLLLIIGEALSCIRDRDPSILDSISKWQAIIGMRNVIVHGYRTLDAFTIRDTIRDGIPVLLKEVESLLPGT